MSGLLTDECPKSVVVPQNILAVQELTMQDSHVTYREIKTSLGISITSIHKILHENLAVKNFVLEFRTKTASCRLVQKKYNHNASKPVYNIYTSDESCIYAYDLETKQSMVWVFQDQPNLTNCHMPAETTRFLEGQKIKLTGHPPYNPDPAPNDFYLFPSVKNKLRGQRFLSRKRPLMRSRLTF
ncbi:hypothetical protein EVAR_97007_1 [Eumeta japonica]|uniref:Mariner Mos1 transposase n=1 Tax=Eumeta variegata TaxID=151549 RepID=A0A4C2A010_EUMVA|nr:hypothetical protein EVAR_97007_1 [Eumeta japonica]